MDNKDDNLVLGITGTNGAGKDTVAEFFNKKGWNVYSHSDELRNIANKIGMEINRENLVQLGNQLRRDHGNGILSHIIMGKLKKPAVLLSIRHPEEVKVYKNNLENFHLLSIDAPLKLRYERSQKRGREGEENLTFEEFKKASKQEMKGEEESQQIGKVLDMADIKVENNSSLEDLYQKLNKIYKNIR